METKQSSLQEGRATLLTLLRSNKNKIGDKRRLKNILTDYLFFLSCKYALQTYKSLINHFHLTYNFSLECSLLYVCMYGKDDKPNKY